MELEFFGAAGEVTGSLHVLRSGGHTVFLDCGMIQGGRDAPVRNRQPLPVQGGELDAVVLSHAHIDHCGRLPLLVKRGYRGPIHTNKACAELLPILLRDSADLAERDAERQNRYRDQGDPPVEPLFTLENVEQTLKQLRILPYNRRVQILPGFVVQVRDAGHIMGSSSVEVWLSESQGGAPLRRKLVFSGDLGQYDSPILEDPWKFEQADIVLMETTYGNRRHRDRKATEQEFGEILRDAWRDRGNIIIPAFAIGRSQEVLYLLGKYADDWQVGRWQIFLDSPMAIEASAVYWNHSEHMDAEARRLRHEFLRMPPLPNIRFCRTADESRAINNLRSGAIIIAGSGMCNGGRVLHHLKHNLERRETHIIITGFQAPGTLGRQIVDRAPEVRIHNQMLRVAAQVHTLGGLSAHGDQEDLLRWIGNFRDKPPVYLVHGEITAATEFGRCLGARGWRSTVTSPGLKVDLAQLTPLATDHDQ